MVPADEFRVVWIRSSQCDSGSCVEVARAGAEVMIRNSAAPSHSGTVMVSAASWRGFVDALRSGVFDRGEGA